MNILGIPTLYMITIGAGQLLIQLLAYRGNIWQGPQRPRLAIQRLGQYLLEIPGRDSVIIWPPKRIITDDSLPTFLVWPIQHLLSSAVQTPSAS